LSEDQRWYALYTRPRWEKKVYGLLMNKGIESYCPLNKVQRQWSDRVKVVEEPLFKSYVFVRIGEAEKTEVRMTSGVVNFVYWQQKPAVIKEAEIELIRKFLKENERVAAIPLQPAVNQRIKINSGVMMNMEGTIRRVLNNKKAEVVLDSLGYKLVALVSTNDLEAL
jgi:transcription antitermination factor NusG